MESHRRDYKWEDGWSHIVSRGALNLKHLWVYYGRLCLQDLGSVTPTNLGRITLFVRRQRFDQAFLRSQDILALELDRIHIGLFGVICCTLDCAGILHSNLMEILSATESRIG